MSAATAGHKGVSGRFGDLASRSTQIQITWGIMSFHPQVGEGSKVSVIQHARRHLDGLKMVPYLEVDR